MLGKVCLDWIFFITRTFWDPFTKKTNKTSMAKCKGGNSWEKTPSSTSRGLLAGLRIYSVNTLLLPSPEIILIKLASNDKDHARIRRTLSHAFSKAALREQEPLMNAFFDLLIFKLHEKVDGSSKGRVNIVQWLNFTTFDTIGDLCFGESFGALRTEEYHNWILNLFKGVKFASIFRIINAYPIIGMPLTFLLGRLPGVQKAGQTHRAYTREKMIRRLETETTRKDFIR